MKVIFMLYPMPITDQKKHFKQLLSNLDSFCRFASGLRLRRYQQAPARAILRSVREGLGHSIVVLFPRQSGKNELQAQLESYLLLMLSIQETEIIKVSPTWKPQSLNAMRRLERVLENNRLTRGKWKKESGYIYRLGRARIFFLSGQPEANIVGATASTMLEVDEAQEILIRKFDKEIAPMAASTNATRVFWGTAWTSTTLLARELRAAQAAEVRDGIQRVFRVNADVVAEEVPAYGRFVEQQVARLGRQHPMVKTQFFSEELAGEGGMFPPERIQCLSGNHTALSLPIRGASYAFLIDFAGEDRGMALNGEMDHPDRDATALTIVEIDHSTLSDPVIRASRYRCVQRQAWRGILHTELYSVLLSLVETWQPRWIVTDATGLGAPLSSFLERAYPGRVIPFVFNASSKSKLGWDFLAMVDGRRWLEFASCNTMQKTMQEAFFQQLRFTEMNLPPGSGKSLRWSVPDGTRDPQSGEVLHDDWVLSAALATQLDNQPLATMNQTMAIAAAADPLVELDYGF